MIEFLNSTIFNLHSSFEVSSRAVTKLHPHPTWRDLVDILFLTLVAYQLYQWFRETRALRVLSGLVVLGGIYSVAKLWGLFLTRIEKNPETNNSK